jgi:hypothetical protein
MRRAIPLAGWLLGELAAVALVHRLGAQPWAQIAWADLGGWLASAGTVDALMAVLRVGALAVGWWLLATTLLTAVAGLAGADGVAARVRPLTLAAVRGAVDRCVAAGVSVTLVVPGPAAVAAQDALPPPGVGEPAVVEPHEPASPPSPEAMAAPRQGGDAAPRQGDDAAPRQGDDAPVRQGGDSPARQGNDAALRQGQPRADPRAPAPDTAGHAQAQVHVVAAGEHLWRIAADHLAAHRGVARAQLTPGDVASYWHALVAANADRLRSGDPDLVYPGERIRLPPP